jgi:hypothetical protein
MENHFLITAGLLIATGYIRTLAGFMAIGYNLRCCSCLAYCHSRDLPRSCPPTFVAGMLIRMWRLIVDLASLQERGRKSRSRGLGRIFPLLAQDYMVRHGARVYRKSYEHETQIQLNEACGLHFVCRRSIVTPSQREDCPMLG